MGGTDEVSMVTKKGVGQSASEGEHLRIIVFDYGTYVEIIKLC
jgi:hypothetical protein